MAEDQESPPSVIENLALVTDAIQTMFPDGKIICVYELNDQDFKKVQENFRKIDNQHKRFLDVLNQFLKDKSIYNCIVVSETSKPQKKYLYSILENLGIDKKLLYRRSTTFKPR